MTELRNTSRLHLYTRFGSLYRHLLRSLSVSIFATNTFWTATIIAWSRVTRQIKSDYTLVLSLEIPILTRATDSHSKLFFVHGAENIGCSWLNRRIQASLSIYIAQIPKFRDSTTILWFKPVIQRFPLRWVSCAYSRSLHFCLYLPTLSASMTSPPVLIPISFLI